MGLKVTTLARIGLKEGFKWSRERWGSLPSRSDRS
jgi:hypothetical protein